MSHVRLIAAGKELPLCDFRELREHTGGRYAVSFASGFRVSAHEYYRNAVDGLGLEMKPFQYELDFESCQTDLDRLLAYLRENFAPGEEVELWSVWVGDGGGRTRRYRGGLAEFDLDTLGMLYELQYEPDLTGEFDDQICQVCITVKI